MEPPSVKVEAWVWYKNRYNWLNSKIAKKMVKLIKTGY